MLNKQYPNETIEERKERLAKNRRKDVHKRKVESAEEREKRLVKARITNARWRKCRPEKARERNKRWRDKNLAQRLYNNARRRAAKLQRSPGWVTEEEKKAIANLFIEAERRTKATGIKHDVHHIYHLQGRTVSGLHVLDNLVIMTKKAHQECHSRNSLL